MARARNIKPSFFTNDILAENDPLARLLFIGLWTLADFKGDLEWRTKRIKAQVLPYDECDVEKLAINLDKSGFIRFYSDGDRIFVKVLNFCTHQNPHKNEREKGTDVPEYSEEMRQAIDLKGLAINRDKSRGLSESSTSDPADSLFLNPDSLILIPDSSKEICPELPSEPTRPDPPVIEIPTNRFGTQQETYIVTQSKYIEWCETYPAVDVEQALKTMRSWCLNNSQKRKTKKGMPAFIDRWLAKEQDKGGSKHAIRQQNSGASSASDFIGRNDTDW